MRSTLLLLCSLVLAGSFGDAADAQETKAAAPQLVIVQQHSPVLAGVISALIPGSGQAYNGQWGKAAWFFAGQVSLAVVAANEADNEAEDCAIDTAAWAKTAKLGDSFECANSGSTVLWLAFLGNGIWSIVDAARSANHLNAEARARIQPTASAGRVGFRVSVPTD